MIVAMVRKFTAGEGDGSVDQGRVRDGDACNDAGRVK